MKTEGPNGRFYVKGKLYIPDDLFVVVNSGRIYIESDVVLGYKVNLLCGHHDYRLKNEKRISYPDSGYDITIKKGAWIGSLAIIIGPCIIGENSVVGAGSVLVHDDIPPGELWAGNPARFIKKIDFKE